MNSIKNIICLILISFGLNNCSLAQTSSNITVTDLQQRIGFLASDQLKGRLTGTPEMWTAGEYIANSFQSSGLKPAFGDTYFQEYEFISDIEFTSANVLKMRGNNVISEPVFTSGFVTLPFSGSVTVKGAVVFAGYGISAEKLKYDDYAGIDVTGKVVIVFRGHPEYDNPHSQFEGYASLRKKASLAKAKGASAIIFVNAPAPENEDRLAETKYDRAAGIADFAVMQVKRSEIDPLLKSAGIDLNVVQESITASKQGWAKEVSGVTVSLRTEVKEITKKGINVAGILEATGNLKDEYVVLGAHFDHLGMGGHGSLYRGTDQQIHNGADDNASGTAGLLELAELMGSQKERKRSLLFIAFSGEELGLLGSAFFTNHSPIPTDRMITMINMDMIGRLPGENKLIVYGTGTAKIWKEILNKNNTAKFELTFNDEGFGPSDHSSFYAKNIPVLFFFTGTHTDYHRPSDDADKINYQGEQAVVSYISGVLSEIMSLETKPEYINVPRKEGERSGGWKVYVGTIPDYAYTGKGLKITGVNNDSPAQKAGLKGGDIILKFGSKNLENIYDFVAALQDHTPGDKVELNVLRGEEKLTLTMVLGVK